jgi:hypothetical protein
LFEGQFFRQGDDHALGDLRVLALFRPFGRIPEALDVFGTTAPIGCIRGRVERQEEHFLAAALGMPAHPRDVI